MIQLYGSRIAPVFHQNREFRVVILQARNISYKAGRLVLRRQIAVTLCTALIARRRQIDFAAMLDVAFGAIRKASLLSVVNWAVMASETS